MKVEIKRDKVKDNVGDYVEYPVMFIGLESELEYLALQNWAEKGKVTHYFNINTPKKEG